LAKPGINEFIAVIGLGRFGTAVAETLVEHGHEVLAIDGDPDKVQALADRLPHLVQADCTDVAAVRALGLADVDHAVVAIGTDLEASVMTVMALTEVGVKDIWAKATNPRHGEILRRVGAHHVSFPEIDQGIRVAHLLDGQLSEFLQMSDGFAVGTTRVPADCAGKPLTALQLRQRSGITVIGVKRAGQPLFYADAETVLSEGDEILISGDAEKVRRFADKTLPAGS
jgi:trk system potassium uptake protein